MIYMNVNSPSISPKEKGDSDSIRMMLGGKDSQRRRYGLTPINQTLSVPAPKVRTLQADHNRTRK